MGGLIVLLIFLWVLCLGGGIILGKLTWTPPNQKIRS